MNVNNSLTCSSIFLWISSIVGFVVDSIALIALISQANLTRVATPEHAQILEFQISDFVLKWNHFTLVLTIYISIAFFIIGIRHMSRRDIFTIPFIVPTILFHFDIGLMGLWVILFASLGSIELLIRLIGIWSIGLLLVVWSSTEWRKDEDRRMAELRRIEPNKMRNLPGKKDQIIKHLLIVTLSFVIIFPAWIFLEIDINHLELGQAILAVLGWGTIGIIMLILILGALNILMATISRFLGYD